MRMLEKFLITFIYLQNLTLLILVEFYTAISWPTHLNFMEFIFEYRYFLKFEYTSHRDLQMQLFL
jgi:hypothetical protein